MNASTCFVRVLACSALMALVAHPARSVATPGFTAVSGEALYFEANHGQAHPGAKFIARGRDSTILISPTEASVMLSRTSEPLAASPADRIEQVVFVDTRVVRFRLNGANPDAAMNGIQPLAGKANYFLGNDPSAWRVGVPLFGKVQVDDVYPGIQLIYYCSQQQLEYDFIVAAGADPDSISFQIEGADRVQLDAAGNLVIKAGGEEIRQHAPVIYQIVNGARVNVSGGYRVKGRTVSFRVGKYDRSLPLIIDPVLTFSTYIGGTNDDRGRGIATDGAGNVYVVGETLSSEGFVLATNTYLRGTRFFGDAFIAKFEAAATNLPGTNLSFVTYFGGRGQDGAFAVAMNAIGEAFITGFTDSTNFPVTNAVQSTIQGTTKNTLRLPPIDAFVTKLNPDGTLNYSTFLGHTHRDAGYAIAVDSSDRAYVTGLTESSNFPTVNAVNGVYWVGSDSNYYGTNLHRHGDAFVARLNVAGNALDYYTYLGGSNVDVGRGIAVDEDFAAYVVGMTQSTNFPITSPGATNPVPIPEFLNGDTEYIRSNTRFRDCFISKISSNGVTLEYSHIFGGFNHDEAIAVAVNPETKVAYVTGYTYSTNFPGTNYHSAVFVDTNLVSIGTNFHASVSRTNYNADAFVTKFDDEGMNVFTVVFGGVFNEQGVGIATDGLDNVFVIGSTASSTNFGGIRPAESAIFFTTADAVATNGFNASNATAKRLGTNDVFIVKLDTSTATLTDANFLFSVMLGGSGNDHGSALAYDAVNNALYITGSTTSTNFPVANNSINNPKKRRKTDAFVGRIDLP